MKRRVLKENEKHVLKTSRNYNNILRERRDINTLNE